MGSAWTHAHSIPDVMDSTLRRHTASSSRCPLLNSFSLKVRPSHHSPGFRGDYDADFAVINLLWRAAITCSTNSTAQPWCTSVVRRGPQCGDAPKWEFEDCQANPLGQTQFPGQIGAGRNSIVASRPLQKPKPEICEGCLHRRLFAVR